MDLELLKAHVASGTHLDICPVLESDGSNVNGFYCADVVGGRRFVQNFAGYPRSEIAEINDAASLEEQISLLSSLQDYSPSDNPNAGKTDAEIMLGHKSKYIQTPSESVRWLEGQLHDRSVQREAASSEVTIKFDNVDVPENSVE